MNWWAHMYTYLQVVSEWQLSLYTILLKREVLDILTLEIGNQFSNF